MCSVPAPACTGCQAVEAALVGSGTTVPLSPNKITFPQLLGVAGQAAHLSQFFEPNPSTPNPMGGQPTHLSTSGGVPPQKANTQVHPEVACGILVQPQQNGHGLQSSVSHVDPTRAAHCSCAGGHTVQALTVTHSHAQTRICARQAIRASQTSECFRGYGISECSKQLRTPLSPKVSSMLLGPRSNQESVTPRVESIRSKFGSLPNSDIICASSPGRRGRPSAGRPVHNNVGGQTIKPTALM